MKLDIAFKDGRKETFYSAESFNITEEQCHTLEVAQTPSEGKLFEVNPLEIDRSKIKIPIKDVMSTWLVGTPEWTWKIIQRAFAEVDKQPEKYASPFYTLIPKRNWESHIDKDAVELKKYAKDLGGLMANWVEKALEWAQRISNGESWEGLLGSDPYTAECYQMVDWKIGYARFTDGSRPDWRGVPMTSYYFDGDCYNFHDRFIKTVPLVVLKKSEYYPLLKKQEEIRVWKLEIIFKDGRKESFDDVVSLNVIEEQNVIKVAQTPSEGKCFEVTPLEIDRSKFKKPMKDRQQEGLRKTIQEAFAEVDKQPEKYAFPFYTMIPKKNWDGTKTFMELKKYAKDLGGHMADWVEQALEWAQRISNGESWETICNNPDTAEWFRIIIWKYGETAEVGGSCNCNFSECASRIQEIYHRDPYIDSCYNNCVPLVVINKK